MLKLFIALSVITILASRATALADTQCHCPTINADGKGNSSCSASETGKQCTIDFNRFPDNLEESTVKNLNDALKLELRFPPTSVTQDVVNNEESAGVLDLAARDSNNDGFSQLLFVYLSIATSSRNDANEIIQKNDKFFYSLFDALKTNQDDLRKAFIFNKTGGAAPIGEVKTFGKGDAEIKFSPGCLEAKGYDIWVMYKAYWSPAASHPQCE